MTLTKLSQPSTYSSNDSEDFLQKILQPLNWIQSDRRHNSKRKSHLEEYRKYLEKTDFAWQDWKFSVQMIMEIFKDDDGIEKR